MEKPEEDTDKKSEEMKKEVEEKMKKGRQEDKVPGDTEDKVDKATEAGMRELEKSPDNVQYLKGQRDRIFMDKNKTFLGIEIKWFIAHLLGFDKKYKSV